MKHKKCKVIRKELTAKDIENIRNAQRNTSEQSGRKGEGSAFSKALKGSKTYLEAQGLITKNEEGNS